MKPEGLERLRWALGQPLSDGAWDAVCEALAHALEEGVLEVALEYAAESLKRSTHPLHNAVPPWWKARLWGEGDVGCMDLRERAMTFDEACVLEANGAFARLVRLCVGMHSDCESLLAVLGDGPEGGLGRVEELDVRGISWDTCEAIGAVAQRCVGLKALVFSGGRVGWRDHDLDVEVCAGLGRVGERPIEVERVVLRGLDVVLDDVWEGASSARASVPRMTFHRAWEGVWRPAASWPGREQWTFEERDAEEVAWVEGVAKLVGELRRFVMFRELVIEGEVTVVGGHGWERPLMVFNTYTEGRYRSTPE